MTAIPLLMSSLCRTFLYFGFKINWKPGKTESFVVLRGKYAVAEAQKLHEQGMMISLPSECEAPALRVVLDYKHLGSYISRGSTATPDVQNRVSSSMSAFCPLSKKVFGNARIDRAVRNRLFASLDLSRLLYNVHDWSAIPRVAYSKFNAVYMRGLRRIAGAQRYQQSGHGSDQTIRVVLRAPSPQCLIHRRRLLLLSSVVQHAPTFVTSLLAARDSTLRNACHGFVLWSMI